MTGPAAGAVLLRAQRRALRRGPEPGWIIWCERTTAGAVLGSRPRRTAANTHSWNSHLW